MGLPISHHIIISKMQYLSDGAMSNNFIHNFGKTKNQVGHLKTSTFCNQRNTRRSFKKAAGITADKR